MKRLPFVVFIVLCLSSLAAEGDPTAIALSDRAPIFEFAGTPGEYRVDANFEFPRTVGVTAVGGDYKLSLDGLDTYVWEVRSEADVDSIRVAPRIVHLKRDGQAVDADDLLVQYAIRRGGSVAPYAATTGALVPSAEALDGLKEALKKDLKDPKNSGTGGRFDFPNAVSYDVKVRVRSRSIHFQSERNASLWLGPDDKAASAEDLAGWFDQVSAKAADPAPSGRTLLFFLDVSGSFTDLIQPAFEATLRSLEFIESMQKAQGSTMVLQAALAFYDTNSRLKVPVTRDIASIKRLLVKGLDPKNRESVFTLDSGFQEVVYASCFDVVTILGRSPKIIPSVIFVHDAADSSVADSLAANAAAFRGSDAVQFYGVAMDSGSACDFPFPAIMLKAGALTGGSVNQVDRELRGLDAVMLSCVGQALGAETIVSEEGLEVGSLSFSVPSGTRLVRVVSY